MIYALDTNIISYFLKNDEEVRDRFRQEALQGNEFIIPPIAFYEIRRGLLAKGLDKKLRQFDEFCQDITIGEFDYNCWLKSAEIYAVLSRSGFGINDADLFIAAFCLVNGYTLVTNNVRHFMQIEDLALCNWKNN